MKRLIIVLLFAFPLAAASQIINIPGDFNTIQEGIDAAADGDTVLVQPGTYPEHLMWNNKMITLASLFLTTGDTNYIASTIIDGEGSGKVLRIEGAGPGSQLSGFSIVNGYLEADLGGGLDVVGSDILINDMIISNCTAVRGGGMSISHSPTALINLRIESNEAIERGAGIWLVNSSTYMDNCILTDNTSPVGSGMYFHINSTIAEYYYAVIQSSVISNNMASGQTAGLFVRNEGQDTEIFLSLFECDFLNNEAAANGALQIRGAGIDFIVEKCSFLDNTVTDYTAGICIMSGCRGEMVNSLVCSNIANTGGGNWNGGGLTAWGTDTEVKIINCTFANNDAGYGEAVTLGPGSFAHLMNSIFWNNGSKPFALVDIDTTGAELVVDYCNVQYGQDSVNPGPYSVLHWGENNIVEDPLFMGTGDDPYSIADGSPCIDAGIPDTSGMELPPFDFLGNVRIWDGSGGGTAIIDMGAYEYGAPVWVGIDENTSPALMSEMNIQVFPNPAREWINLSMEYSATEKIQAEIYALNGMKVRSFADVKPHSGHINKTFYVGDLPPGIYFIRVKSVREMQTKKIIVL